MNTHVVHVESYQDIFSKASMWSLLKEKKYFKMQWEEKIGDGFH